MWESNSQVKSHPQEKLNETIRVISSKIIYRDLKQGLELGQKVF